MQRTTIEVDCSMLKFVEVRKSITERKRRDEGNKSGSRSGKAGSTISRMATTDTGASRARTDRRRMVRELGNQQRRILSPVQKSPVIYVLKNECYG